METIPLAAVMNGIYWVMRSADWRHFRVFFGNQLLLSQLHPFVVGYTWSPLTGIWI